MAEVTVTVTDGPLLLKGVETLNDPEGNVITTCDPDRMVALCRCGMSSTKPMCDGTHGNGFDGALNPPS